MDPNNIMHVICGLGIIYMTNEQYVKVDAKLSREVDRNQGPRSGNSQQPNMKISNPNEKLLSTQHNFGRISR